MKISYGLRLFCVRSGTAQFSNVTGYELDDRSHTSGKVTDAFSSTLRPDGSRATRPPTA
jgi:hypothetical protein